MVSVIVNTTVLSNFAAIGQLGLLSQLEQANHWLEEMIRQGYRSPVPNLKPLIEHR